MSSLRISNQSRAVGPTTAGGDAGRAEHSGGASFAVALGAAGTVAKNPAATLLGGQTGDASSGPALSGKRSDLLGKPGAAASLAVPASLTAPLAAAASPASETKHSKRTDSTETAPQDGAVATNAAEPLAAAIAPSLAVGVPAVMASSVAAPAFTALAGVPLAITAPTGASPIAAAAGSLAVASTSDVAPADGSVDPSAPATTAPAPAVQGKRGASPSQITATGAGSAGPSVAAVLSQAVSAAPTPQAGTAASGAALNPPGQTRSTLAVTLGGGPSPASMPAAAVVGVSAQPSANSATLAPNGSITAAPTDFGTAGSPTAASADFSAAGSTIGTDAAPALTSPELPSAVSAGLPPGLLAPGHAALPSGQAADLTSGVPADAAADASSPPTLTASAASPQAQLNLSVGLSQVLPLTGAGQPNTGGASGNVLGGPLGDRARDRLASVIAAPDSVAAASPADGGAGTAPLAASPGAMVDPAGNPAVGGSISDQVTGRLVQLVSSGSRDMVMRLHPPELGTLTVQVTVSGRDVSAWFASPQPEVQNAISAGMGQLQTDLGNAGYNLNGAWVGADASGAQRQSANPLAPPPSRASSAAAFAAAPAAVARPSTSGLNIYV